MEAAAQERTGFALACQAVSWSNRLSLLHFPKKPLNLSQFHLHSLSGNIRQDGLVRRLPFAEAQSILLTLKKKTLATILEMIRDLIRSMIYGFLRKLPPIYGTRWLLEWENKTFLVKELIVRHT
jgi:hypothetical protein